MQRLLGLLAHRQLGEGGALVGQPPGEELVEDHAERVDVRGGVRLLAARLLGGEVGRGPDHRSHLGDPRLLAGAGDAEVRELHGHVAAARGPADDHQVPGLDVAVDDPVAVGVVEAGAGLHADLDGGLRVELALGLEQLRARAAARRTP